MNDQITSPGNQIYFARSYLISVQRFLKVPGLLSGAEQRQILATSNRWLGEQLLETGNRLEGLQCLLKSELYDPSQWSTFKQIVKGCLPFQTLRRIRDRLRGMRPALEMSHGLHSVKGAGSR